MADHAPTHHPHSPAPGDDEIDLRELFLAIWRRRLWVALATAACTALAVAYSLLAPKVFESTILLIPTDPPKTDQVGAAMALFGKKGGGFGDLELYQALLTSRTVTQRILRDSIRDMSDTGRGRLRPLVEVWGLDTSDREKVRRTLDGLADLIQVESYGNGGGIIQVTTKAGEPWLAQQLADKVVGVGQAEIRRVRMERFTVSMARIQLAASQARQEWDEATGRVARYREQNRSIFLPGQQLDLARLEMERQVKEQKYLLARRELEQQLLEREKAVPPAMVLDSADLPPFKTKPKRTLIVALALLVSFCASSVGAVVAQALQDARQRG